MSMPPVSARPRVRRRTPRNSSCTLRCVRRTSRCRRRASLCRTCVVMMLRRITLPRLSAPAPGHHRPIVLLLFRSPDTWRTRARTRSLRHLLLSISLCLRHPHPTHPPTPYPPAYPKVAAWFTRLDALAVGSGLGRDPEMLRDAAEIVERALKEKIPVVLDGDGLALAAEGPGGVLGRAGGKEGLSRVVRAKGMVLSSLVSPVVTTAFHSVLRRCMWIGGCDGDGSG